MKRSRLNTDPALVRAWQQRSRERAARRRKAKIPIGVREAVRARQKGKCAVCGWRRIQQMHHVLPESRFPQFAQLAENLLGVCVGCHASHEGASRRIPVSVLPVAALDLAAREGFPIERYYR
jgi:hypothetical protein